jgi:RNA-binding protein YlmH
MKDDDLLKNRFKDLADKAYHTGQYCFTGFLNMAEVDLLFQASKEFPYIQFELFGGSENCERVMASFGSEELMGYTMGFPITCLEISPLLKKFSDEFSHRDFLGALMNLGIERSTIGDIIVKEKQGFLFCRDTIAEFIIDNLTKVKHTHIKCSVCHNFNEIVEINLVKSQLLVSSLRCDVIISKMYQFSRSQAVELFTEKKVFVNGKSNENNSGLLKTGDIVAVRGYGKFIFGQIISETKKGKLMIEIQEYS